MDAELIVRARGFANQLEGQIQGAFARLSRKAEAGDAEAAMKVARLGKVMATAYNDIAEELELGPARNLDQLWADMSDSAERLAEQTGQAVQTVVEKSGLGKNLALAGVGLVGLLILTRRLGL